MDKVGTTSDNLDQTDEEILTPTVSDEALEAAACRRSEPCITVNDPFMTCLSEDFGVPDCAAKRSIARMLNPA